MEKQRKWNCNGCRRQFSVKVGTIFEDSPISLSKWLPALWLVCNAKNGISSCELARALGVTQKTAWFMLQRLRLGMQETGLVQMGGKGSEVEVDETFIGGKARNMHQSKREKRVNTTSALTGKECVMGFLERGGKVRTFHVESRKRKHLQPYIQEHVKEDTSLYTDAHPSYVLLQQWYRHEFVDHAVSYAEGRVHTNGLENYWSLLKRSIRGTYVSVEPFHLFRYLDEQAFRYNERKRTDAERFALALTKLSGKRLTYSELTGKELGCQI
jgi:transposase-like protein